MFKKSGQPIYKITFLFMLSLPLLKVSFELTFAIFFLLTLFFLNQSKQRVSSDFLTAISPLLLILLLGITVALFHPYYLKDTGKDIAYFLKPVFLMFIGYSIIHSVKDQTFFFKIFVYLGIAFAIFHLFKLITYPDLFNTSINTLRNETGLSNPVELLAIVFIFLGYKYPKMRVYKDKSTTKWVLALLLISFILYFSRTMWVAIFLLLLASFGYAKISLKALKYIGLFVMLIGSFYIYLYSVEIDRNEPGVSAFLYKMKIAPEEIFLPKIDLNDHAALWDHWRAYEAKMAFDQMASNQHILGRGFGSLVDLHFVAPLNDDGMQYISHLHNGYAMIYYKTGILGLFIYLLFLFNLYFFTFYKKNRNYKLPIIHLITAIGIYLIFSSLIISGVYNLRDVYLLALGGLFAQYDKIKLINKHI